MVEKFGKISNKKRGMIYKIQLGHMNIRYLAPLQTTVLSEHIHMRKTTPLLH